MKNKGLIFLAVALILVLAGAGIAYNRLADQASSQQLGTVPQTAPTEAPTAHTTAPTQPAPGESTEATQAAQMALDFTVYDFEGNKVNLFDFTGKPIVLNFWATWCNPCRSEMPAFNQVYEQLDGEVLFLMINAGEETQVVEEYITKEGFTFPVYIDSADDASRTYGITAYPTSFFINAKGELVAYAIGAIDEALLMEGIDMIYTP